MKQIVWALAAMLSLSSNLAFAKMETAGDMAMKADALRRTLDRRDSGDDAYEAQFYMGYVVGIRDTLTASGILCVPPEGTTGPQVLETVALYLKQHPQRWSESATVLIVEALK